jgi:hypothetical protein
MNLVKDIENLKEAKKRINNATGYTTLGLIYNHTQHDSSLNAKDHIEYVLLAEKLFLDEHRKEILERASDLITEELDNALFSLKLL